MEADVILEAKVAAGTPSKPPLSTPEETLRIDGTFPPVPLLPSRPGPEVSLHLARKQLVLLRGRGRRQAAVCDVLRSAVTAVYSDSQLSPFAPPALMRPEEWTVDIRNSLENECPIPPCDCRPANPRGSLPDVAQYLGADLIWRKGPRGDGIVVGIVDGGILAEGPMDPDLPGLVPQVIDGWPRMNWGTVSGWGGHANMLAIDVLGMAPCASLYDIRIFDPAVNAARVSDAIAGIHWAIEKFRATGTPHVLCCGWGLYQHAHDPELAANADHPLSRKVVEAIDEGILVLFAAGNGGQCCPATLCGDHFGPGNAIWGPNGHPRVMTVGAVNIDEELVGYSSQGPGALDEYKPDFAAISHFAGYFSSDSGTSAACAVATGVLALLKQARPNLTQEAARRLLKLTAKDLGPPGWDRHTGAGIIQAKAAYDHVAGHAPLGGEYASRLEQLELENRCLRELYVNLAIQEQLRIDGQSNPSADSRRTRAEGPLR